LINGAAGAAHSENSVRSHRYAIIYVVLYSCHSKSKGNLVSQQYFPREVKPTGCAAKPVVFATHAYRCYLTIAKIRVSSFNRCAAPTWGFLHIPAKKTSILNPQFSVPDFERVVRGGRNDETAIRADRAATLIAVLDFAR